MYSVTSIKKFWLWKPDIKEFLNLFTGNKLNEIEKLPESKFDPTAEFEFAESCIEQAKNIKFRAVTLPIPKAF